MAFEETADKFLRFKRLSSYMFIFVCVLYVLLLHDADQSWIYVFAAGGGGWGGAKGL